MTDQVAPSPQSLCDHPAYAHHVRGGEPLTIPLCQLCGEIGWDNLREQMAEHRRMVLAEAADYLAACQQCEKIHQPRGDPDGRYAPSWASPDDGHAYRPRDERSAKAIRRLAAAAPETTLSARVPAENAPAVPEDTPGGFHELDEPTDHIVAAFDAGTHGRTAPPRGQNQRLDVAAGLADGMRTGAEMALGEAHGTVRSLASDRNWLAAQVARYQRVVDAATEFVAAMSELRTPDRRQAALDELGAAVDALPDVGTDQTEGEALTFFERRASRDPSIDHSSHSMQWVGKCPSDTTPEGADERNGHDH